MWLHRNRQVLGDNFPSGKYTGFRRQKIVFNWQVWPDKATLDAAEVTMHQDKHLEALGEIPFDPKRLILGCFAPIFMMAALDAP